MSAVLLKGMHMSEFRRSSVGDLNGPISQSTVIFQLRRWSESQLYISNAGNQVPQIASSMTA